MGAVQTILNVIIGSAIRSKCEGFRQGCKILNLVHTLPPFQHFFVALRKLLACSIDQESTQILIMFWTVGHIVLRVVLSLRFSCKLNMQLKRLPMALPCITNDTTCHFFQKPSTTLFAVLGSPYTYRSFSN